MANARLRLLDSNDKEEIISAVTAAAEKHYFASMLQKGEDYKTLSEIHFICWDGQRKAKQTLPMAETRPLPAYMVRDPWNDEPDQNKPVYFDALSAVSQGIKAVESVQDDFNTHQQKVRNEIRTVLAGRCNAKQAMERWPGLKKVYPKIDELVIEASQQLAVITDVLDQTFAGKV